MLNQDTQQTPVQFSLYKFRKRLKKYVIHTPKYQKKIQGSHDNSKNDIFPKILETKIPNFCKKNNFGEKSSIVMAIYGKVRRGENGEKFNFCSSGV